MPTKDELKQISETRLKEAKALLSQGFYDGSIYLSGYVVETALKARICKLLEEPMYPESGKVGSVYKTHKIDDLILLAGLRIQLDDELANNSQFYTNWSLVTNWSETFRYRPIGSVIQADASGIIDALEDTNYGIFTWIKKRW